MDTKAWFGWFFKEQRYWLGFFAITIGCIFISHKIEKSDAFREWRYGQTQWVMSLSPEHLMFQDTVVVLVDDETYYRGAPASRSPIKRDFIAALIAKIAESRPALIAIDFDLRASIPDGKTLATSKSGISLPEDEEYIEETVILLQTINELAEDCKIVLPSTFMKTDGIGRLEANIYDGFKFHENVNFGHIQLDDDDTRTIPPVETINNGSDSDSFSLAITRAYRPQLLEKNDWHQPTLSSFVPSRQQHLLTTTEVLDSGSLDEIRSKIVIVGGGWHQRGIGRGPLVLSLIHISEPTRPY